MLHSRLTLLCSILHKIIIVIELVTSDDLRILGTITDHSHLVVEGNEAKFTVCSTVSHVCDLLVDSGLKALHSAYISDISFSLQSLIRAIAEFHQFLHLCCPVTLDLELTLNGLRAAHGSRLIDTEDDRDLLLSKGHLVLDLGGCLQDVVDGLARWLLFLLKAHVILCEAELAFPDLLLLAVSFDLLDLTVEVQSSSTVLTEGNITSGELGLVSQG